jgi:cellobiose phosphorylase
VIIAETMVGNGDRAFEYYQQINTADQNDRIDEFECEPYVYPQNILGDEHPQFGLARNSWLTGTAAWIYIAATEHILGIMPTYTGLHIGPCIPSRWSGFKATRVFRKAQYRIEVTNPDHVCEGISSLKLDGSAIAGSILPVLDDEEAHRVEVVIG